MSHSARKDGWNRKLRVERLESREMLAGDFSLLKDINSIPIAGLDYSFANATEVGGKLFFSVASVQGPTVLARTDGTESGTFFLHDPANGQTVYPTNLTNVSGTLYFTGDYQGTSQRALWRSDGTAIGTYVLTSLPVVQSAQPLSLINFAGVLYFVAPESSTSVSLWKSDGTQAGTQRVRTFNATPNSSTLSPQLTQVNDSVYFVIEDHIVGRKVFKSDGTFAGTTVLVGQNQATTSQANNLTAGDNALYFTAYAATGGLGLWRSDGTVAGTVFLSEDTIYPSGIGLLKYINGTMYFTQSDDFVPNSLWKSDGTPSGTVKLKQFTTNPSSSFGIESLVGVGSKLYFTVNEVVSGRELWVSDGTSAGTILVSDLSPGSTGSYPSSLLNHQGQLYFRASSGQATNLWRIEGTQSIPREVVIPQLAQGYVQQVFLSMANSLFLVANDGITGTELWKTVNNAATASLVKDLRFESNDSNPRELTSVNGLMFFAANDGFSGEELWRSDGTANGTFLLKDITPGPTGSTPTWLTKFGNQLFFITRASDFSSESLWVTDGTTSGTLRLGIFQAVANLAEFNGKLFFRGTTFTNGDELWVSDGSVGGTVLFKEIRPGSASSNPSSFVAVGTSLFFSADDGVNGQELWKTDGTSAGTVLVRNIRPGGGYEGSSSPLGLRNLNGQLIFLANDGVHGIELWKSNGTAAGTSMIKDIAPGSATSVDYSSRNSHLFDLHPTVSGGALYFQANDGLGGRDLWKTDGTSFGTVMVKEFNHQGSYSGIFKLTDLGGRLFFASSTQRVGESTTYGIWSSDGTTVGTNLISSSPQDLPSWWANSVVVNGKLYYPSDSIVRVTDGTAVGTRPLDAPWLGRRWAFVNSVAVANDRLYVVTDSSVFGNEIWTASLYESGDYNRDNTITPADRTFWQTHFGATTGIGLQADGNNNGVVDTADYTLWRDNYIPPNPDYNRDTFITPADHTFWAANFGATTGAGLQADGNANNIVDAADYTLWRDAYVPPTVEPAIAIASAAVSRVAPAQAIAARPIASSPPRRTDLLIAARDAAFAELGDGEEAPVARRREDALRSGRGPKLQIPTRL